MAQFPQRKPLKTYKRRLSSSPMAISTEKASPTKTCWKAAKGEAMGRHFFLCSFTDLAFVFPETPKAEPSLLPTTLNIKANDIQVNHLLGRRLESVVENNTPPFSSISPLWTLAVVTLTHFTCYRPTVHCSLFSVTTEESINKKT